MKEIVEQDATSYIMHVFIVDAASTSGSGITGLTSGSSGLKVSIIRPGDAAATVYTGSNLETIGIIGTYAAPTSGKCRFKEISATDLPGWYEIQLANALFASGARSLNGSVFGVSGTLPVNFQIMLNSMVSDLYTAQIDFNRDQTNSKDEYAVIWFKNGIRITSGITSPTIQVVKRVDGTDLVASASMTAVGTVGFKYDEATNRLTLGESAFVVCGATIGGSARTFAKLVGRDST